MSGGQRIDDHGSWAGKGGNGNPLPMSCKEKHFTTAEGAGHLGYYEDTDAAIKAQQEANLRQQRKNPFKPGQRN